MDKKPWKQGWIIGDGLDEPRAITLPNPPPEIAAQITSDKPLHRPDRARDDEPTKKTDKG